jgi:hypothetical protein
VGRTFIREGIARAVSTADSSFPGTQPAAPTVSPYGPQAPEVSPFPAGIWRTEGAPVVLVDIVQTSSSTSNTYTVLAWNRTAGLWMQAATITPSSGVQAIRTAVANWGSDYAFVVVTGSTVAATVYVLSAEVLTG